MKKLFTIIAIAAFMAACGGNANKKAKVVEEQKAEVEVVVVDTCAVEGKACTEEKACCEGEAAAQTAEKAAAEAPAAK